MVIVIALQGSCGSWQWAVFCSLGRGEEAWSGEREPYSGAKLRTRHSCLAERGRRGRDGLKRERTFLIFFFLHIFVKMFQNHLALVILAGRMRQAEGAD